MSIKAVASAAKDPSPYEGPIDVQVGQKCATITTDRLHMRNIKMEDLNNLISLLLHPVAMKRFQGGPRTSEQTTNLVKKQVGHWESGDYFAALIVEDKMSKAFMGFAVAGHGEKIGESVIAGIGVPSYYAQGHGKEGAEALKAYVLTLSLRGALVNIGEQIAAAPLQNIHATAREDNRASVRIQDELGMHRSEITGEGEERRIHFTLSVEEMHLCKIVSDVFQSRKIATLVAGFCFES